MSKIFRRIAILSALPALMLAQAANAQVGIRPIGTLWQSMSHTCVNPNNPPIFTQPDGGYHEPYQGWFYQASVVQSASGWAFTECWYGLDMAAPANRPVHRVHFEMTGYYANECTVSGATVTCSKPIVAVPLAGF